MERLVLQNEMRICLAFCDSEEEELFLSERGQWLFILADFLKRLGHSVAVRAVGEVRWWGSAAARRLVEGVREGREGVSEEGFDVVIDIGGSVSGSLRRRIAKTVVVFLYNNVLFDELQDAAYLAKGVKRHLQRGTVDQIWIWEGQEDHCAVLSGMYHCPVRCLPFIWSDIVIKELCSSVVFDTERVIEESSYTVFQTNKDNTMCAVWPLSFLNERKAVAGEDVSGCAVYDLGGVLEKSKFYKDNIENNLSYRSDVCYMKFKTIEELYAECSKSVTIFHTRYKPYQIHILNFLWMGLPLIHNSLAIRRGMGFVCWNYFEDNSFSYAERALETVQRVFKDKRTAKIQRENIRGAIVRAWAGDGGGVRSGLANCLIPCEDDSEKRKSGWTAVIETLPLSFVKSEERKKRIIISFSDMWEGFDASDNFFIDLLRSRGVGGDEGVMGVDGVTKDSSLHICGPFGGVWQLVPIGIPIVFFSGERWERDERYEKSRIKLFLTHDINEDHRHIRLPLWILFLELWGGEPRLGRNPNGLPLSLAVRREEEEHGEVGGWKSRKRFCGFVVSNPMNMERNMAFELLNAYEDVDSGGAYKNNIGGPIAHMYGGGGGGDVAKHAFLKERRFCLCYENSSAPGYVTEKLLHAKMAGCVPIYWGCQEAGAIDFDKRGFIDMTGVPVNEIVARVDEICLDEETGRYMAQIPALGQEELGRMWACVERVGDALIKLIEKHKDDLGDKGIVVMGETVVNNRNEVVCVERGVPPPMFVSFATKRFLPSIEYALAGVKKMGDPRIEYLLYTGSDVSEEDISGIKTKYGEMLHVRKLPCDESPVKDGSFPDFWNPRHFGWKIWIYNQIAREFTDRLLVYSDAGAQWQKEYPEMFEKAWKTGICFVLDQEQNKNRFWCSEEMISEMKVTEEELEAPQILGGIMAIRGGHEDAIRFFDRCLKYAYNPRNLRGRKLIRVLPGGQPIGHRHDQSIMSVERVRSGMGFGYVMEDKATCMESLRRTLQSGTPIYLHRGNYVVTTEALNKVNDIWMINLERRLDRLVAFNNEYPTLGEVVHRFSAIDGKALQLTPTIAQLFYHNDFKWKKSVIGCALSHILLWAQLACEGPGVNSYLVLEDDVRFTDRDLIDSVFDDLPEDVDVAYLGGVLPRNRGVYSKAIQSVNNTWAQIMPNTFFSKTPAPVFHHCNYAYYITKTGARKLLKSLVENGFGCFTSIDHYMGHPMIGMKKYVLVEPIAVCFQENDPKYSGAAFDDFNRIDSYDSDIWNNNDVYKVSKPDGFQPMVTPLSIPSLYPIICDVLRQIPSSRETCTLLGPGSYIRMLVEEKRGSEVEFMKIFLEHLQIEMKMPATVPFGRRIDTLVLDGAASGEVRRDCTAISVVESSGENYIKSCLMSKMFLIRGDEDVGALMRHIAATGSVPIYVRHDGDEGWWKEVRERIGLVELRDWNAANRFISILLADSEKGEKYRWGVAEKCLQAVSSEQVGSHLPASA